MGKKETMSYSAIPSSDDDKNENGATGSGQTYLLPGRRHGVALAIAAAIAVPVVLGAVALARRGGGGSDGAAPATSSTAQSDDKYVPSSSSSLPMPRGVNLGSWLSLEDYFYVGRTHAVEVATSDGDTVGRCLPPLHTGPSSGLPMWNSETDLYASLKDVQGVAETIKMFHAFRVAYLDFDEELPKIAGLGIKNVRVPVSWCLTDHDPENDDLLAEALSEGTDADRDAELERRYTCFDPFFGPDAGGDVDEVRWPAVPRPFVERFLRACGRHGVRATIDVHTYPGGTSPGTFSGVWPRSPRFWLYDDPPYAAEDVDPSASNEDFGRKVYGEVLTWLESLAESDPDAFKGLGALTPMNEPGHLAGLFAPGGPWEHLDSWLPPLPDAAAQRYLSELDANGSGGGVPPGPHLRVLLWQSDAVSAFRSTSLPSKGVELHVNIHESVLTLDAGPDLTPEEGGRLSVDAVTSWWRGTTTAEERSDWAVLDMHHYHAWAPECQGTVDGPPGGNYTCGDAEGTAKTLGRCTRWAGIYRTAMDEGSDDGAPRSRLAAEEFSASTHHSVLRSCVDVTTLRKTYSLQVETANDADVEMYFWSWKMPHGGAFRRAWSFKHFLYLMGVEGFDKPDESEIQCE